MKNYQIFISYRREGGDSLACHLADRLTALGYKVFFDVESMRSGPFNTQILDAVSACDDVLIVLPPNGLDRCTNEDDWVRKELAFAIRNNKNIIPVMMRGFEFPASLPAEIDSIRYMEGVKASSEYFDAVIEKIKRLLVSGSGNLPEYRLEDREYYKIQTPLFSPYKQQGSSAFQMHLKIGAFIENLAENNGRFRWSLKSLISDESQAFKSLKDYLEFYTYKDFLLWYEANKERLDKLNKTAAMLKSYRNSRDLYFYRHALFFADGCLNTVPQQLTHGRASGIIAIFCYCVDIPADSFEQLENVFGQETYAAFRTFLPLPFEVWPNMHSDRRIPSQEREEFDKYAVLLFDFMLELSVLLLDAIRDSELAAARITQIRSYYKWLKKNKLYPPKEIQKKLYEKF